MRMLAPVWLLTVFALAWPGGGTVGARAVSAATSPEPDSLAVLFATANDYYGKGRFADAVDLYRRVEEAGVIDKDLYYNMGNAYYRMGEIGRAVLYYERATRIAPRDEDIKANLALVRSLLRDKQFVGRENWLQRAISRTHRSLNASEAMILSSVFYVLGCLVLVLFLLRARPTVASLYRRISLLSPGRLLGLSPAQDMIAALVLSSMLFVFFGAISTLKVFAARGGRVGVVVAEEALVYSAPSEDSTLQFKIHEGTKVKLGTMRGRWVEIDLPGGLSGWIDSREAERI